MNVRFYLENKNRFLYDSNDHQEDVFDHYNRHYVKFPNNYLE
jgi:hypothetical protein